MALNEDEEAAAREEARERGSMQHAYFTSDIPGEHLMIGWRDPKEKYPRIWIRRWAADGTAIDFDIGFLAGGGTVAVLTKFLERFFDHINRIDSGRE